MNRHDRLCGGCRFASPIYMGDGDELMTACVYILRTGRRRPGPAGEGCTVYEPAEAGAPAEDRWAAGGAQACAVSPMTTTE